MTVALRSGPTIAKTQLYDLMVKGFLMFMEHIRNCSFEYGCDSILYILMNMTDDEPELDHLCDRPDMSFKRIGTHAKSYISEQGRDAQNSWLVFKMIRNSITTDTFTTLLIDKKKYMVNNVPVGALFLKTIYSKVAVNSRAEVRAFKNQLHGLSDYMKEVNDDISAFNEHVQEIILGLAHHGEVSSDILDYCFMAYKMVKDDDFHDLVCRIDNDYKGVDITQEEFFEITSQFYKDKVKTKTWEGLMADEQKIIDLQSTIGEGKQMFCQNKEGSQG
jgi:hypothetical protein